MRGCARTPSCSSRPTQIDRSATGALLDADERLEDEVADGLQLVAAFLDGDGGQAECSERAAGGPEAGRGDGERALGVAARGVHPESHHDRAGPAPARPLRDAGHRLDPLVVAGTGGQRDVPIGARARTGARLLREAEVVGEPARAGVHVHRSRQHGRIGVEDRLGPVAVVGVDVEHRDPAVDRRAQPLRRGGRVVEVAGAAEAPARHVMAGRAAARVGGRRPRQHQLGGRDGGVHRGTCGLPRARPDERHRVVGELPGPGARGRGGDGGPAVREEVRLREQVRDDPVLAGVGRQPGRLPLLPRAGQVAGERRVMDAVERRVGLLPRADHAGARGGERRADALRAGGQLRARRADADPYLAARLVQPVAIAPDDGHGEAQGRERTRSGRAWSLCRAARYSTAALVPAPPRRWDTPMMMPSGPRRKQSR